MHAILLLDSVVPLTVGPNQFQVKLWIKTDEFPRGEGSIKDGCRMPYWDHESPNAGTRSFLSKCDSCSYELAGLLRDNPKPDPDPGRIQKEDP